MCVVYIYDAIVIGGGGGAPNLSGVMICEKKENFQQQSNIFK